MKSKAIGTNILTLCIVKSNPQKGKGGLFHPLWILQSMVMTVLNKSKEKLYNPIECIITENEGKKHKINRVEYSTLKDILRSLYYQKITINVCQFVYIMTGVKLKKQNARIFYWHLLAEKTGTINQSKQTGWNIPPF